MELPYKRKITVKKKTPGKQLSFQIDNKTKLKELQIQLTAITQKQHLIAKVFLKSMQNS